MARNGDRLTLTDKFLLKSIESLADTIADHQDAIAELRRTRDDLIREACASDISKSEICRASELSLDQVRNIETYRYSRESRRKKRIHGSPEHD